MLSFFTNPGLANIAFTWLLFMTDLTLKGSIVLITAFLVSKICAKAPFQFHHLIIFLGLCSFAVLPAIYQLDLFLVFPRSSGQEFNLTRNISSGIPVTLLHNLALFAPWLMMIWLAGFICKVTGIIAGMLEMQHIKHEARRTGRASWNKLLKNLTSKEKISQKIEIRETVEYPAPITCGLLKGVIILPREARVWNEEQQQVVLLHELSHIRRYDNLLQFIARLIAAVFWFNPLVWTAIRLLRHNREGACDDYVLNAGFKPSDYAGHLLGISHACRNNRPYHRNSMVAKERVMNILDTSRITRVLSPKAIILSVLMGFIFMLPFSAINPVAATERIPPLQVIRQVKRPPSRIHRQSAYSTEKTPEHRSTPHPTQEISEFPKPE